MLRSLLTIALWIAGWPLMAATLPNRPLDTLDLARYSGQWHEIAHLPMYFERKCLKAVTATYTPNPDGTVHVHNSCRTAKGMMAIDGVARMKDHQPAALEVRFAPAWLTWLPVAWADYWVIEVAPDYQWAVVGSPNRKHLWILSRHPALERGLFTAIRERARERGYPVDELILTAPLD